MEQEPTPSATAEKQEWFLFLGDDYRGPFTWQQVEEAIRSDASEREVRLWKEGMVQWQPFEQIRSSFSARVPDVTRFEPPIIGSQEFKPQRKIYYWFLVAAAMAYALYTYQSVNAFPQVQGVSRAEYKELKRVALASSKQYGTVGSLVLAPGHLGSPQFHVSANLPDGAQLEVRIQGIAETLVDNMDVVGSALVQIKKGYAKSQTMKLWYASTVPRGDYNVWLLFKGRVLAHRMMFLGGVKDDDYKYQLDLYQATIRLQAEAELEEVRQLTATLGRQMQDTKQAFSRGKRWWPEFHETWLAQQEQINVLFKSWVPQASEKGFYYSHIYRSIRDAGNLIVQFHTAQNLEMQKTKRRQPASEKLTEQALVIEKVLASIRDSITVVEQKAAAGKLPRAHAAEVQ